MEKVARRCWMGRPPTQRELGSMVDAGLPCLELRSRSHRLFINADASLRSPRNKRSAGPVMIIASHNPVTDSGIKVFDAHGRKSMPAYETLVSETAY